MSGFEHKVWETPQTSSHPDGGSRKHQRRAGTSRWKTTDKTDGSIFGDACHKAMYGNKWSSRCIFITWAHTVRPRLLDAARRSKWCILGFRMNDSSGKRGKRENETKTRRRRDYTDLKGLLGECRWKTWGRDQAHLFPFFFYTTLFRFVLITI